MAPRPRGRVDHRRTRFQLAEHGVHEPLQSEIVDLENQFRQPFARRCAGVVDQRVEGTVNGVCSHVDQGRIAQIDCDPAVNIVLRFVQIKNRDRGAPCFQLGANSRTNTCGSARQRDTHRSVRHCYVVLLTLNFV